VATTRRQIVGASGVREARSAVRSVLVGRGEHAAEVAALLASELVTNAVVHSGGAAELTVSVDESRLRVAVADSHETMPVVSVPSHEDESGRGLAIVDALANAWGVETDGNGKSVWFELELGE
jgi:anti-sigma regulatory factor (Ser/Thr protein kinase)